eukprot:15333093-Ditylum_brightwellii.AAC.1
MHGHDKKNENQEVHTNKDGENEEVHDENEENDDYDENNIECNVFCLSGLEKVVDILDFCAAPRMSRHENREIEVHQKKQADELIRLQIIGLEHQLQYKVVNQKEKKIAKAMSTLL